MNFVNLIKTGNSWKFATEADLEDFVWANLKELFGLIPLKRQYYVKGQICDILALNEKKQLVVLELKNGEDRYIVQQLTRYYEALLENKPFQEEVDYGQPISLIAIKPNFHRDNLTDRKYSHLSIQFLYFQILLASQNFYLELKDLDNGKLSKVEIPYQERDVNEDIPAPPRAIINRLAKCDNSSENEREAVLRIRKKILGFDKRIQEIVKPNSIEYGKGKSKLCAEFYFGSNLSGYQGRPHLFLRLPEPEPYYRQSTLRMYIFTEKDWTIFSRMVTYRKGFISNKNRANNVYEYPSFIKTIKRYTKGELRDARSLICYEKYEKLILSGTNSLELLVNIALETWLNRL
ncbi:endonuclease NucS domain-containing protein [Nostoc sp. CHAB 5715]|uniref:endonuclease NucS domain-containing protein n=1 Tax=Nostoc sp. CHAB 5715 TaxID=2780400 RepID=UPI001E56DCF6|nr:endonuclease NucS domain-containing protein [Nostoc sp. CHAB 5715]MCC5622759.1 endonuclease NucS [Nostoc sp. CHAB 5715]